MTRHARCIPECRQFYHLYTPVLAHKPGGGFGVDDDDVVVLTVADDMHAPSEKYMGAVIVRLMNVACMNQSALWEPRLARDGVG
ncbi:hypothetical protein VMCG_00569 [Cytospora schulzeri]|uniref:Uncharacterized protein n=1 Tax=Cytospora schulzeri TaxID=448051 RepID=A0A423XA42_9PEZI|nr:hypothetical protein VMCG_00569 [Valsa malicola]